MIPARGAIDTAAVEFLASLISRTTGVKVHALNSSAGLSALNEAAGEVERLDATTLVLATVGGLDRKHLSLIARRAEREFPGLRRIVFDFGRQAGGEAETREAPASLVTCVSARELAQMLKIAPAKQATWTETVPAGEHAA
jgi:hypothetical protein